MSVVVFLGPTLRRAEAAEVFDATYLPPAAQGDVVRAVQQGATAIGVIDGYFSGAPAVWHKEILWALSQGVAVYGSASMGALRAAELHGFGMRGVGRIFEAFRDSVLEDDDEVAVVHGPAETGYVAASEPMVNIRATLARAEATSVLAGQSCRALADAAKAMFFAERTWTSVLDSAHGIEPGELAAIRQWLPQGRVDQKRRDALEMLAAMREETAPPASSRADFRFERTHFFDALAARMDADGLSRHGAAVLEELRLEGSAAYAAMRERALLRRLAAGAAARRGVEATPAAKRAALGRLRAALGLFTRAELEAWMARHHLDAPALERLAADQVLRDATVEQAGGELDCALLDELRLAGAYERLAERARVKSDAMAAAAAMDKPGAVALRVWYFERRLDQPMPEDIAGYARELGFRNLAEFDSALEREWLYQYVVARA